MDKNELIELISNGKTEELLIKLEADRIDVWRNFYFVLEDIVKKYFR